MYPSVSQLHDFGHLVVVILEIRCPKKSSSLMEDNLRGKKTPLMGDYLQWKITFDGIQPLESNEGANVAKSCYTNI